MTEHDPIFDSVGDISTSQNITLSDMQSGFGNWELGRPEAIDPIEAGRRDNGATVDSSFMQELEDPLNNLKIGDDHRGIDNNGVDFDFDLNDGIDYGDIDNHVNANDVFNLPNDADASLDTLMQVGIVEDENTFNIEAMSEPAVRRRKRLVVDQITEIPQEDLRRYISDSSAIVNTRVRDKHYLL